MYKRNLNELDETNLTKKSRTSLESQFQNSEYQNYSNELRKISFLLENIISRLDSCENKIKFLVDNIIKEEQDKLAQKLHDEEIFRSYVN